MKKLIKGSLATELFIASAFLLTATAQDQVKYRKNYERAEIIIVGEGMPCPSPTVQI